MVIPIQINFLFHIWKHISKKDSGSNCVTMFVRWKQMEEVLMTIMDSIFSSYLHELHSNKESLYVHAVNK